MPSVQNMRILPGSNWNKSRRKECKSKRKEIRWSNYLSEGNLLIKMLVKVVLNAFKTMISYHRHPHKLTKRQKNRLKNQSWKDKRGKNPKETRKIKINILWPCSTECLNCWFLRNSCKKQTLRKLKMLRNYSRGITKDCRVILVKIASKNTWKVRTKK